MVGNEGSRAKIYGLDGSNVTVTHHNGVVMFKHGEPGETGYWAMAANAEHALRELRMLSYDNTWEEFVIDHFGMDGAVESTVA